MKNIIKNIFKIVVVTAGCLMFASFSPSLDGRAVVVDNGVFPQGLFAKTVGYLPGDIISVTNIAGDATVDLLVIGALDPSEGVAIMLSPEAAEAMGIEKGSNNIVKITKRSGQDERVYGNAVISKSAAEIEDWGDDDFENIGDEENTDAFDDDIADEAPEEIPEELPESDDEEDFAEEALAPEEETEEDFEEEAEEDFEEEAEEDFDDELPAEEEAFEEDLPEEEEEFGEEEFEDESPEELEEAEEEAFADEAPEELPESEEPEEELEEAEEEPSEDESFDEEAFDDEKLNELPEETEPETEEFDEEAYNAEQPAELPEEEVEDETPAEEAIEADELEALPEEFESEETVEEAAEDTDEDEVSEEADEEAEDSETEEYEAIVLVPVDSNPPENNDDDVEDVVSGDELEVIEDSFEEAPAPEVVETPAEKSYKTTSYDKYIVPSLKDLESGKYYIQIAVYSADENILEIINKYGVNYPITIVPMGGGVKKQILVGPLSMDEYKVVLERFKSYGFKDSFLRKIR